MINVINNEAGYLKTDKNSKNLIRLEICLSPLLLVLPVIASILLIKSWFYKGYLSGSSAYDYELILAIVILIGNIVFDIPFVNSLLKLSRR